MRWKAHFFLHPDQSTSTKENFGFKSTKNPPPIDELKDFEDGMMNIIQTTKFKPVNNKFLNSLNKDVKHIKNDSSKLLIPADKNTNFYKLEPQSTTNSSNKTSQNLTRKRTTIQHKKIQQEDKKITVELGIADRVDITAKKEAFITLKDHKPNFANKPTCRLINLPNLKSAK